MVGWIKVSSRLADNKKFYALQAELQKPDHEIVGGLVMFWNWCFDNASDGILTEIHRNSTGRALRVEDGEKWFDAMVQTGFIDRLETGEFEIHDWFQWAGSLHKDREKDRQRKAEKPIPPEFHRKSSGIPRKSTPRAEESRADKSREELPPNPQIGEDVKTVIEYLNEKLGTHYKIGAASNIKNIKARLSEGHSVDDCKKVIDNKIADWKDDEKMAKFLRPETLFGSKFQGYLNQKKVED
ncbi:MAG: conserved phage C-terminal domain-containing protein, partial [Proteobacteria bacterium]|nr:conserved phage C-terminal domain-containing protein [Pseudomonadota bacterium]